MASATKMLAHAIQCGHIERNSRVMSRPAPVPPGAQGARPVPGRVMSSWPRSVHRSSGLPVILAMWLTRDLEKLLIMHRVIFHVAIQFDDYINRITKGLRGPQETKGQENGQGC